MGWSIRGIELPFGEQHGAWWVDDTGGVGHAPIDGAEELPGSYFFSGLVDAHAHPAIAPGAGPAAQDASQTSATLLAWAEAGVTLVRDVGSPAGVTLDLASNPRHPHVLAAGRFLAPTDRYFPELLVEPVEEPALVAAALAEVERGATWVKVIGDFPLLPDFTDPAPTYSTRVIEELTRAVHAAGARVAVHSTLPTVGEFVTAGVDSIEHGPALDGPTLDRMAATGTGWTPTCCALFALAADPDLSPERRRLLEEEKERMSELLPYAVAKGVPVLAGTDVAGSMAREVALLADLGLDPSQALAAASDTARTFLGFQPDSANIVTYAHDPRDDPSLLDTPAAVVVNGIRVR
jgi:Amidohydrolase family